VGSKRNEGGAADRRKGNLGRGREVGGAIKESWAQNSRGSSDAILMVKLVPGKHKPTKNPEGQGAIGKTRHGETAVNGGCRKQREEEMDGDFRGP